LYGKDEEVPYYPTYEEVEYTPPVETWKTYEDPPSIIYPDKVSYMMENFSETTEDIYVSFGLFMDTLPPGVLHINSLVDPYAIGIDHALRDKMDVISLLTISWDIIFENATNNLATSGDNLGFLFDAQQLRGYYYNTYGVSTPHTFTIKGLDVSKTYTFEISGYSATSNRYTRYTMNSHATDLSVTDNLDYGATETGITGVTTFDIIVDAIIANDPYMFVTGLNIKITS